MKLDVNQDWNSLQRLLPQGWQEQAKKLGAFSRSRYTQTPADLLRLLLVHASFKQGLRKTAQTLQASGLSSISHVGLFQRLKHSKDWLLWMTQQLIGSCFPKPAFLSEQYQFRVLDSTLIQRPRKKEADLRLHYSLNLSTLSCDGFVISEAREAESLTKLPWKKGDVLVGDRNFGNETAIRTVVSQEGEVLVRLRWNHLPLSDEAGHRVTVLSLGERLSPGESRAFAVGFGTKDKLPARLVLQRLPEAIAKKNQARLQKHARDKGRTLDPRSIEAARYVAVLTTLPPSVCADDVLAIYRFRWQVELSFKRLKQLLHLGYPPHKDDTVVQAYVLAKLLLAFLCEALLRNRLAFSPWGF